MIIFRRCGLDFFNLLPSFFK